MAVEFYSKLFTADSGRKEDFIKGHFPNMEQEQIATWETEWSAADSYKALKEMGS